MAESNYMSNEELKELLEAWDADENIPATPQYQQPSEERLAAIDENPQLMTDNEYDWMIQDLERAFAHVPQTIPLPSDAWYNPPALEHTSMASPGTVEEFENFFCRVQQEVVPTVTSSSQSSFIAPIGNQSMPLLRQLLSSIPLTLQVVA